MKLTWFGLVPFDLHMHYSMFASSGSTGEISTIAPETVTVNNMEKQGNMHS